MYNIALADWAVFASPHSICSGWGHEKSVSIYKLHSIWFLDDRNSDSDQYLIPQPPASKKAKKDINPSVLQGLLGGDVQVKLEDDPSDTADVITTVVPSKKPKVTTVTDRSSTTSDTKSSWGDSDFNPWEAAVKDEPQSGVDNRKLHFANNCENESKNED